MLASQAVLQEVQRQEACPGAGGGSPSVQEVEWGDVSMHLVSVIGSDLSFLDYNNRRSKVVAVPVYLDRDQGGQ